MKAFIGWSGRRGLRIATAMKGWVEALVPGIEAFISPDLPKGQAWFGQLAERLHTARIGLMCLAPPRVAGEWQLIEAGAVWKAAGDGGLFPLCFGLRGTDIPAPLQVFQSTAYDHDDFLRLAHALLARAAPGTAWTNAHTDAFERAWAVLKTQVDAALQAPDDAIHTTAGFVHEVAGCWWERVRSEDRRTTKLSWVHIRRDDELRLTIAGVGFGERGSGRSEWRTDLVGVEAEPAEPVVVYYWEGRVAQDPDLLFGGTCTLRFTISDDGRILHGRGEFRDVCLNAAREPATKLVELRRASADDVTLMTQGDDEARRRRAAEVLRQWR